MISAKVSIQTEGAANGPDDKIILLSDALAKEWEIPAQQPLQLEFGCQRIEVQMVSCEQDNVLRISAAIANKWGLAAGDELCICYHASRNTLSIGPLIGVLIKRVFAGAPENPFGSITGFCRELSSACSLYGAAVFFFTPDDARGKGETVKGWHYSDRWVKRTFPLPNVVYNRLTSRKLENQKHVQNFIRRLKSRNPQAIFNERYLNKAEVFEGLRKETHLQPYLPESRMFSNYQVLKTMCLKYPTVFLKPIMGSLGRGIIRIRRVPEQAYVCDFIHKDGSSRQTFRSLPLLFASLSKKAKSRRYQIQQGISLITVNDRPVDFRALVQRDETGRWNVTSIVARIAGTRFFVSNLARGGSLTTVKDAIARSNSGNRAGSLSKLKKAALQIAEGIDLQINGHFAELGIDLAMDTRSHVMLIEVNTKPSKTDNTRLSEDTMIRPSVKQVVKYCKFISNF